MKITLLIIICLLFSSCSNTNSISNSNKDTFLYDSLNEIWQFALDNGIEIHNFPQMSKTLKFTDNNIFQEKMDNLVFVKSSNKSLSFFSSIDTEYYRLTIEPTNYYYFGEINRDNEPDGLGMIMKWDYTINAYFLKYIGNFKNGLYDGYGIEFNNYYANYIQPNNNLNVVVTEDYYEGTFSKGFKNGKGNEVYCISDEGDRSCYFLIGEYKDDKQNGKIKEYWNSNIFFDGTAKDGNYSKGTLYSVKTGLPIYDGEFLNGIYHGKGTLYDENGNVKYKGEFVDGDIK